MIFPQKAVFIVLASVFVSIGFINAQSIEELELQKKRAQEKLNETQKLLDDTRKSRKGTEKEIYVLTQSIKESNNLIFAINSEIDGISRDITILESEKNTLSQKLENVKKEYAKMVVKNEIFRKQFSPVLFIFSSANFMQGIRRTRYLIEMSNYRKKQLLEITGLTKAISEKEIVLQSFVTQKTESLQQKENENKQLTQKKDVKHQLLKKYSKQEKEYSSTISQERQRQKNLNSLIQKKVAEENRKKAEMAKKAEEQRSKKKSSSNKKSKSSATDKGKTSATEKEKPAMTETEYKQYKEDLLLTGSFAKNRGNLPMPVEQGRIHRRFGRQINPSTNAAENNSGIYILSPNGTDARAIFDGRVFEVMYEPGSGYIVWITHGSFSTVYAQLSLFYVKKGEKIKANQKVGKIALKNNNTELNFYILNEDASYENPENWLAF